MENISQIFDGSKRKRESGFFLHGVGTQKFLLRLDPHKTGYELLPQKRKTILEEMLTLNPSMLNYNDFYEKTLVSKT